MQEDYKSNKIDPDNEFWVEFLKTALAYETHTGGGFVSCMSRAREHYTGRYITMIRHNDLKSLTHAAQINQVFLILDQLGIV